MRTKHGFVMAALLVLLLPLAVYAQPIYLPASFTPTASPTAGATRTPTLVFTPTVTLTPTPTTVPGRIAFASDRDGNLEIYTMGAGGGPALRLTNNTIADSLPAWSPDGTRIVFTSAPDAWQTNLAVVSALGGGSPSVLVGSGMFHYSAPD